MIFCYFAPPPLIMPPFDGLHFFVHIVLVPTVCGTRIQMQNWELFFFFVGIALVFSMVGFGGRNSYVAVLGFYALPYDEIRLTALICNIVVVSGSSYVYLRKYNVDWRKIVPLVLVSIPFSFIGAQIKISHTNAYIVLGINLMIVATVLWVKTRGRDIYTVAHPGKAPILKDALIGGYIGFLSSMLNIGGGIFLAPLLNFRKWDNPKKIATISALFILANSICSLAIVLSARRPAAPPNIGRIALLCIAVLIGSQIGARIGAHKMNIAAIRRLTAALVFLTGLEVLARHLPVG